MRMLSGTCYFKTCMGVKEMRKKDMTFSVSGIRKELKRIRWPKLKAEGNDPGILQNTGSAILFTASFAVIFVLCNFVLSRLLLALGI